MKLKKKKPTYTQRARGIITGSFILYLIDSLLDADQQNNLTTIRLKQYLQAKTRVANATKYILMSNKAWDLTIQEFKDEVGIRIVIFDAVEMLAFDNEEAMELIFGSKILDHVSRFSLKQTKGSADRDTLLGSRRICKALKDNMSKVIFESKDK